MNNLIGCLMCGRVIEHLLHLFFDCDFASNFWRKVVLSFYMREVESAPLCLVERLNSQPLDMLVTIVKVLAGIWFARNGKVWEDKTIESGTVVT